MISWIKYKDTPQTAKIIAKLVGPSTEFPDSGHSEEFLVSVRFKLSYETKYCIRFARIDRSGELHVNGMIGNVEISDWAIAKLPKDVN